MSTVPNHDIVTAAVTALQPFHPVSAQQVADMLLFWARRRELTEVDLAEVQRRMFPAPKRRTPAEKLLDETAERWRRLNRALLMGDPLWRDGYAEGYLDAILQIEREGLPDDDGFGERFLEEMLERRRQARREVEASEAGEFGQPEEITVSNGDADA